MKGGSIVDVERVKERNKRVAKANEKLKKIISYNVRYYRTIRGMNEDELASYLGKKGQYIKKLENGELKALPFYLESNGTRKMFHLFDFFMDALKNGMVLFVDELDAKLHPLLTRYIINLFHNSEKNIGNGQLIYSTHDTVNLNKETFRRDEIWFVEKDKNGVSELYSLSDYIIEDENGNAKKVRNDATYNKDYLTGRYGAIPVLEKFDII